MVMQTLSWQLWEEFERGGQRGVTCFSLWRLSHTGRVLQGVSWERLHEDPCRLPHFRFQAIDTMPSKNCISSLWDFRPFFND